MKKIQSLSVLFVCMSFIACGGDPKSASGKPDSLWPNGQDRGSSSSSSVGGDGGEPGSLVNQPIPFHENFNNAVDTRGFFSSSYKGLNSDAGLPFYFAAGGFLDDEGNVSATSNSWITGDDNRKLQLGNGRFTIGQTRQEVGTTTADTSVPTWGEFDLSRPYKISFCVSSVGTPSNSNFEIYVDNNTTGGNNSRYGAGNASRIFQMATHNLTPGQRVEIAVPGASGTQIGSEHSFLQFRVSSGGWAVIDDLVIEYQGEAHGLDLPACVASSSLPPVPSVAPSTPAKPTAIAGDGQLTIVWESAGVGATYELLFNTVNDVASALPVGVNPLTATTATITDLLNDTTYYVFVKAKNSAGSSEFSEAGSGVPRAPVAGGNGDTVLSEDFSAPDAATFFSAAYKSINVDNTLPLYIAVAGGERITVNDGVLSMHNARFTIGDKGGATNAADQPNGSLDLSKPYRIRFQIVAAEGTGNFQVYVDNNTTGAVNSIHAGVSSTASRLLQQSPAGISAFPYDVEINSDVGTATSLLQLRADSSVTLLSIDNLVIEYQ